MVNIISGMLLASSVAGVMIFVFVLSDALELGRVDASAFIVVALFAASIASRAASKVIESRLGVLPGPAVGRGRLYAACRAATRIAAILVIGAAAWWLRASPWVALAMLCVIAPTAGALVDAAFDRAGPGAAHTPAARL